MQRTDRQSRAIHVWCEELARELNNRGLDMKTVLKPEVDIPWTKDTVKDYLWRPVQRALLQKESTTSLDTAEVSKVYDVLDRHLLQKFDIDMAFPSAEFSTDDT
jgi:hypothetical protein